MISIFFKLKAMKSSDLDKDGQIDEEEWRKFINKHRKEFWGAQNAAKMFSYINFSPTYSCNPPKVFILLSEPQLIHNYTEDKNSWYMD